jgi:hypothetical protein
MTYDGTVHLTRHVYSLKTTSIDLNTEQRYITLYILTPYPDGY